MTISRGAYHRKDEAGKRCQTETTKSGKGRVVVIPPHMRADLKHHLDTNVAGDSEALLFGPIRKSDCGHLSQNVFREAFNAACKTVGREGVTIHALRHFGGTMAAQAGATMAETMSRLGHSTLRAAGAYQHSVNGRDAVIAEKLSAMAER